MKKWKKKKIKLNKKVEMQPVKIINCSAIASKGVGDGRMIPLIILDTCDRPDIEEVINVHKYCTAGDVKTAWFQVDKNYSSIGLIINIQKPSICNIILHFVLPGQAIVVDQVIKAQALFIQAGKKGDKLYNTLGIPKVIIEVPSREFEDEWEKIFFNCSVKNLRSKGIRAKDVPDAAKELINELRKIGTIRMK